MAHLIKKNLLLIFFFSFTLLVFGQGEKDYVWTGASFNHQLTKKLDYNFGLEYRSEGLNTPRSKLVELGSAYQLSKNFNFKAGMRFSDDYNSDDRFRVHADINAKWSKKKWPLKIQLRNRIQHSFISNSNEEFSVYRSKLKLSWKLIKRMNFYSGFEYFFKFGEKNQWDGERFFVGLNAKFKNGLGCSLTYLVDEELNKKRVDIRRVYAIGLSYTLKRKSKRKAN